MPTIKQSILVAVDSVVFTIVKWAIHVLLIKRSIDPFKDTRCLPGGFVKDDEDIEAAAYRDLEEETSIKNVYLEQLYTFGKPNRDPRGRNITTAYMAIVARENVMLKVGQGNSDVAFHPIHKLPKIGFDHKEIIVYAHKRLQWKLEYTNLAQYLLPKNFPLTDLQQVYEIVMGRTFDVRNFRKKIAQLGIVKETGKVTQGAAHRPAKLYTFVSTKLKIVEVL
jgi:8-oxo-dGTP diphosphatase